MCLKIDKKCHKSHNMTNSYGRLTKNGNIGNVVGEFVSV
jgi:hypothetical protein